MTDEVADARAERAERTESVCAQIVGTLSVARHVLGPNVAHDIINQPLASVKRSADEPPVVASCCGIHFSRSALKNSPAWSSRQCASICRAIMTYATAAPSTYEIPAETRRHRRAAKRCIATGTSRPLTARASLVISGYLDVTVPRYGATDEHHTVQCRQRFVCLRAGASFSADARC